MLPGEVFEEWDAYAKRKSLRPRAFPMARIIAAAENKVVALTGVRRCGKSSLLMLIHQRLTASGARVRYVSMDDVRLQEIPELLDEVLKWNGDEGYLLIDEITSVREWDGWLFRVHEMMKDSLHIIVTSSRQTIRRPSRPLRGRILRFDIYPLSFRERLSFLEIAVAPTVAGRGVLERELRDHMAFGGFPEVILETDPMEQRKLLAEYYHDVLGLDVAAATGTDPSIVELFGRYLLRAPLFSASACHALLKSSGHKIGKEKVLALEAAAKESMLFHFNDVHSRSVKDTTQMPRRAYAGDLGLLGALLGPGDEGRRLENLVYLELFQGLRPFEEIHYWKGPDRKEVDFVVLHGLDVIKAVQVSLDISDPKTYAREVSALASCAKETSARECLLITRTDLGEVVHESIQIRVVPVLDWLMESPPHDA